jgi:hypothetical protein
MPRALDPNQTTEIILAADKDNPQPARFIYRALNCREWAEKSKRWAAVADQQIHDCIDELVKIGQIGLVGWKIEGVPFDHAKLGEIVTPFELQEMIGIHLYGERLNAEDKKNSESPHSSNGDSSAATASQDIASTRM